MEKFDTIATPSPHWRESRQLSGSYIAALSAGKARFQPNVTRRIKSKRLPGGADWIRTGVAFRHTFALFRPEKWGFWRNAQTENHDTGKSGQTARRDDEIRTDGEVCPPSCWSRGKIPGSMNTGSNNSMKQLLRGLTAAVFFTFVVVGFADIETGFVPDPEDLRLHMESGLRRIAYPC